MLSDTPVVDRYLYDQRNLVKNCLRCTFEEQVPEFMTMENYTITKDFPIYKCLNVGYSFEELAT